LAGDSPVSQRWSGADAIILQELQVDKAFMGTIGLTLKEV